MSGRTRSPSNCQAGNHVWFPTAAPMILPRLRSRWTACGEPSPRTACTVGVASEPATKSRNDGTAKRWSLTDAAATRSSWPTGAVCVPSREPTTSANAGSRTAWCFNLADEGGNGNCHSLILPLFL